MDGTLSHSHQELSHGEDKPYDVGSCLCILAILQLLPRQVVNQPSGPYPS